MLLFTGALTSKPYAFTARPWELRSVQSVDISDAVGSNVRIDFKETEILRILPRRNVEINESWISDKARFFYDGLNRQRLNSPFMKKNGELKKVKWSKILNSLTSVLKVYSFEFGSSKIGLVLGPSCDSETFFSARDLTNNFGFSLMGVNRPFKANLDNSNNYLFKEKFQNLEDVDFCLLVGTNPRFEASTLNLRLRKIFRKGTLSVASIGGNFSTTYPVQSLGLTAKTLTQFIEGKHPVCKVFAKASKPAILIGSQIMERFDTDGLSSLFRYLRSSFHEVFKKDIHVNFVHIDSNIVGGLELGLRPLTTRSLNQLKVLYCVGLNKSSSLKFKTSSFACPIVVFQASHGGSATKFADFVLPSTSFVEKNSVYFNMEGRPQRTQRALIGPNLSRDDWRIFRVLFSYLNKSTFYSTHSQLTSEVSKILPSFYFSNSWFSKREGLLHLSSCNTDYLQKNKVAFSYFKLSIEDFYMTDQICQSSRIMAKASQYLRSYFHNYKFLNYFT